MADKMPDEANKFESISSLTSLRWTDLPEFRFIFQMLHKTFAGRVMINNGDIMALIRM